MAVSESERKIDKLKKDNEELRGRLHELQIDTTQENAGNAKGGSSVMDEEITKMDSELNVLSKDLSTLQDKFKRINIVNDQISGWAKRVFGKFQTLVDSPALNANNTDDLTKIFVGMNSVVVDELKKLGDKNQKHEDEDKGVEYGDVFTDFATEDFISKNIRVRPVSGVTHGDETKDGRQSSVSKGQIQTEGNEEGEGIIILRLQCILIDLIIQIITTSMLCQNLRIRERLSRPRTERLKKKTEERRLCWRRKQKPRKLENDNTK